MSSPAFRRSLAATWNDESPVEIVRSLRMRIRMLIVVGGAALMALAGNAAPGAQDQTQMETTARRDARMRWWREARFGMFVHWGLYSGLAGTWDGQPVATRGGMEWIQQRVKAGTDTYAQR